MEMDAQSGAAEDILTLEHLEHALWLSAAEVDHGQNRLFVPEV